MYTFELPHGIAPTSTAPKKITKIDETAAQLAAADLASRLGELVPSYVDVNDVDAACEEAINCYECFRTTQLPALAILSYALAGAVVGGLVVYLASGV